MTPEEVRLNNLALLRDYGHKVKIDMAPTHGTLVYIDGVLVKEMTNVELRHHVGEVCKIKLEFYPSEVEIVGDAGNVELAEASWEELMKLRRHQVAQRLQELRGLLKKRNEANEELTPGT